MKRDYLRLADKPRTWVCRYERVSSMLVELRLAANLRRVSINQLQKGAKDNGRVLFSPCGDKLDPDIVWLQTVEPDTI
jgi:hypothetical protein